jgi:hypothetical protein
MWCDSHLEVRIHVLLTACRLKGSDKIGNWGELYKKKLLESLKQQTRLSTKKKMYKKFGNLVIKKS